MRMRTISRAVTHCHARLEIPQPYSERWSNRDHVGITNYNNKIHLGHVLDENVNIHSLVAEQGC